MNFDTIEQLQQHDDELIPTPLSQTLVPFKGRWTNALYVREYQRAKRRMKHPPKQRLRVKDDGDLGRYYLTDTYSYYKPSPRVYCDMCDVEVYEARMDRHCSSVRHQKKAKLYSKQHVPYIRHHHQ
jgi:hypothetical protein